MNPALKKLAKINPRDRILLLPHCLRQSATCIAKYNGRGLQCQGCNPECSVNRLRAAAVNHGYQGICVAPGGRLAVSFVRQNCPQAVVAVACHKELEEGVHGVREISGQGGQPLIVIIPLTKDGCVDTLVDIGTALKIIGCGCPETRENKPG